MFATNLCQYKTFLEPKKVACCCTLCLEGWEYCSRVLETSPGFYANTDSTTAIPIVLWQYREVNIGIKRSGVSTATPASNPWKDLFNRFITTIRLNKVEVTIVIFKGNLTPPLIWHSKTTPSTQEDRGLVVNDCLIWKENCVRLGITKI